jgi:SAM-dependent methyltransferase
VEQRLAPRESRRQKHRQLARVTFCVAPETHTGATAAEREQLRTTFAEVPELYDKARPLYPLQIFDDLIALANLEESSRVVEIGPGTGQATSELAKRGLRVTGVELSEELATIARRKLAGYRNVENVTADFEEWTPAVGVTAFHWIDPRSRYEKSARLLRTNRSLAVIANRHVLPERSDQFWVDVQSDYDAVVPSESNNPPPHPDLVGDLGAEIEASGLFCSVASRRYLGRHVQGRRIHRRSRHLLRPSRNPRLEACRTL